MSDFIPISKPIIGDEEKQAVQKVLDSGIIAQGPVVQEFEEEFADYCGSKYAVALNSGTAAIHTALFASGVNADDSVITSPFTFIASANPVLMQGARIKFVDIDEDTYNLDINKLGDAYDETVKSVIPVDLFGQPADYEEINAFAKIHDISVIEDACQSIGSTYKGVKAGNLSDFGCFSLYATKNIMSAEGGMMTTNDENAVAKAKSFRQHGMVAPYEYASIGYNFRTTDILASIGLAQLRKADEFNKLRNQNADLLIEGLLDIEGIVLPSIREDRTTSYHQFTIRITPEFKHTREDFMNLMKDEGVGTGIYYPKPLHYYDHIAKYGFAKGDFPVAEKMAEQVVSLPVHPSLSKNDVEKIISSVRKIANA